jgi:adenylate cyclase class 2
MPSEREIKLHVTDVEALNSALARLSAQPVGAGNGRVHELNTIFDTESQHLAKKGHLLRIRKVTPVENAAPPRFLLTFKKPSEWADHDGHGHKVREEIETEVTDGEALKRVIESLGVRAWFVYEKFRTTMKLPASELWAKDLLIELDETPIGTFLELEGPAEAIDRAARELGFSRGDYITNSYLGLYFDECRRRGESPANMLFEKTK